MKSQKMSITCSIAKTEAEITRTETTQKLRYIYTYVSSNIYIYIYEHCYILVQLDGDIFFYNFIIFMQAMKVYMKKRIKFSMAKLRIETN